VRLMKEAGLDVDTFGFQCICTCAQNAAIAARIIRIRSHDASSDPYPQTHWSAKIGEEARLQMALCSRFLRIIFTKLVGAGAQSVAKIQLPGSVPPIPRFLAVPNASELHAYLRALGFFGDHEGILSLVKWMVAARDELTAVVKEELNGKNRFRRLIVALRVYLECPERDYRFEKAQLKVLPASEDLVILVEDAVVGVEEWGGWATDGEVERYLEIGGAKATY